MRWTQYQDDIIRQGLKQKLPYSYIARWIGGVTRNSVIGRAGRLGLCGANKRPNNKGSRAHFGMLGFRSKVTAEGRRDPNAGNGFNFKTAKHRFEEKPEPVDVPILDDDPAPAERVSLLDLKLKSCRYPIGDPDHHDFGFCNRKHVKGSPYCASHTARAFTQPKYRSA